MVKYWRETFAAFRSSLAFEKDWGFEWRGLRGGLGGGGRGRKFDNDFVLINDLVISFSHRYF